MALESTRLFDLGCKAAADYMNASPEEVVIGPSTTQLFRNLSVALYNYITPESEIIVSKLDHEANIASWVQLAADRNCKLKWSVKLSQEAGISGVGEYEAEASTGTNQKTKETHRLIAMLSGNS